MVDIKKLKARMMEKGVTPSEVAKEMDMAPSTLYRKLKTPQKYLTVGNIFDLQTVLGLSTNDIMAIFFAPDVA